MILISKNFTRWRNLALEIKRTTRVTTTTTRKTFRLAILFAGKNTIILPDNVDVGEELVDADLLDGGHLGVRVLPEVDLLHGARLARLPVDEELHLGERPLAEDLL